MSSEKENKKWHYLKVNRGRYLCLEHGSFCDNCDGYVKKCPLCESSKEDKKNWQINPVNRALEIIRGLQQRSISRFSILSGIVAALGLLALFNDNTATVLNKAINSPSGILLFFASICFFASFIFYLASMAHVKVTYRDKTCGIFGTAKFLKKTTKCWERYMVCYLHAFEICHKVGNILLCSSVGFLILFIISLPILCFICK